MKKVLSLALAIVLIVGLLPIGMMSASAASTTYTFANYTAGTQYAEGEVHVLDDVVTVTTTQAHFTTQLRLYSSASHDGYAIITSTKVITGFGLNAGYKADTLNVYGLEADGTTWTLIQGVATKSSYADYTVTMPENSTYTQLKLDVAGLQQVRVASITLTFADDGSGEGGGDEGGDEETPSTDPEADTELSIVDAIALGASKASGTYTTNKYYVTGVISSIANATYGNMNIKDENGNMLYVYGTYDADGTNQYGDMATKPVAGDTVKLYGVVGNYSGTPQMKEAFIVEHIPGEGVEDTDPPADSTLTISEALTLGASKDSNAYTTNKYYVSGEITEVYNTTHGNMYIKDANGTTLTIYGTYDADGTNRYDAMATKPVAGDTVTVYGVIGNYNGTAQMKNGWITAHTPAVGGGDSGEGGESGGDEGGDAVEGESESLNITATGGTLASDSLSISWEGTNFSVVNEKGTSSSAIRTSDSDHFRVYKNNSTTISAKNGKQLSQIVITTTGSTYTTALLNSTFSDGVTAAADGNVVTLTLASAMDAVVIDATSAQWRLNKVEVTYATAGGADEPAVEFTGAQVTLGDDLDMAFSVSIPDAQKVDTMQVEFTVDGKTSYAPIGAGVDGVYTFTVELPTKNMTSTISARLIDGEGTEHATKEYTVRDYAETILNDTTDAYDELEKAAAKAMLNYGAMAQLYFGYNTTDLANSNCAYTEAELNAADVSGVAAIAASNGLESFKGASLVLKSKLAIRLYFTDAVTGSVSTANGHYVEVSGIGAADLDATQTVTVDGATYTFSALSMAKSVIEGESYSANFKNLMKALVLYSAAAEKL